MGKITGVMAGWLVIDADSVLKDHGIVCEDGIVTDITPNKALVGKPGIVDARQEIVSPSFVNTHTHMYESMKHGANWPPLSLKPLLEQFWWPCVENRQTVETIRLTAEHATIEHFKTGITMVNDILEAPLAEAGKRLSAEAEVLSRAGMRGVLSLESNERISTENGLACLDENYAFCKARGKARDIRGTICTHTTFSAEVPFLRKAASLARELDEILQCHMNEGPDEGRYCFDKYGVTTAELYQKIGYWGPETKAFANQCVCMDPVELSIMAKYGVGISTQPFSNALWGNGIAPVVDMLKYGINVGIGTDDGEGNFFESLRLIALLQRGKRMQGDAAPTKDVFRMATELGAKAIGFDHVGTLEKGKCADFIVLNSAAPIYLKERHIVEEIVWYKNPTDVLSVFVGGECVYKDGRTTRLEDDKIQAGFKDMNVEFWKGQPYQD
jgi:cytosine/adenosine deaminase-related metal-dependent hydrolase